MRTPVLVSAVVATVAVAGVASAAIPGSDGAVIACYGGRFSSLPNSGDPLTIGVDVPAGTSVVLAQANMFGITGITHHYAIGRPTTSLSGVEVFCTLAGGGQSNTTQNYVEYGSTWSQNLTITLTAPGRITLACKTPKFDAPSRDDYQYASVRTLRLSATRLPQTRVTRTITLAVTLAALPSTTERRPPTVARLEDIQIAQERQQFSAIARALRQAGS